MNDVRWRVVAPDGEVLIEGSCREHLQNFRELGRKVGGTLEVSVNEKPWYASETWERDDSEEE